MLGRRTQKKQKRRPHSEIVATILEAAKDGELKTRIMYSANLCFAQLDRYLSLLLQMKLLKVRTRGKREFYKATSKGLKYLKNYKEIVSLLTVEGLRKELPCYN